MQEEPKDSTVSQGSDPNFNTPIVPSSPPPQPPQPGVFPSQTPELNTVPAVPPKKSKKALFIGLIVTGVLAILIGGSALAYNYWYQNPDKVVTDSIIHAITAKTVSATGTLDMKTPDYSIKIEASGRNTIEADATVAIKLTYTAGEFSITADGEGIYSAEGDIYVKINDLQTLVDSVEEQSNGQLDLAVFDDVIKKVDSNWVKIGKEDLGDVSEEYSKTQKCLGEISQQLDTDASFRRTVENETSDLYKEHQFIIVGDKIGTRTINGVGSLGYSLTGDSEAAKAFFTGFADTQLGKKLTECNSDINFSEFASDATKDEDVSKATVEIWVSRFGHAITELNLKSTEDTETGTFVVNPVFNKNEPIEIPTNVIPFSELQDDITRIFEG